MVRLVKPSWVAHSGYPIFSCDLHRDGLRFVTGGGDNKIKIWNLNVVKSEEEEQNKDSPKLLAICEHWGPVNCVRFSPNGQRLASCSDDRVVIIWELASKGPTKVFGSDETIHEVWKPIAQLRGHVADVADLCWSPDGTKVASASLDNTIWVWDVIKKTSIVCLKGHTGWVKGVAWDPIGRYLASQSDDKSVIIWRTTDWSIEKKITEPYAKIASTSFFTRISFSPEGGCLATCQGVNKGNPTSVILKRSDWSVQCDFVGHKQPVVCNRWNPCAFVRPDPNHANNNNNKPFYICAIGSQDAGISCWTNINQKAVLVVKDIFDQTVLDVSWSRDGYTLMGCGQDGSVIFMFFQPQDLGNSLSDREHQDLIQQIYGDILLLSSTSHGIAETPLQLSLEEQAKQNPIQENSLPSQTKPTTQTVNILTPRRVVPGQPGRPAAPVRSLAQAQAQGLAQVPRVTPLAAATQQPKPLASEAMAPPPQIPERKKPEPIAAPAPVAPTPAAPSPAAVPAPFPTNDIPAPVAPPSPPHDAQTNGKPEKRKSEAGSDVEPAPPKKPKVKKIKEKESDREREREKKEKKKEKEPADNNTTIASPTKPTRSHPTLKLVAPAAGPKLTCTLHLSPSVVGLPKEQHSMQDVSNNNNNTLSVEASIQDAEAVNPVTAVTCHSGTQVLWEFSLRYRITNITGNTQYFIALATQEGNLFIYSPSGVLMFPAIVVGEQIAYLESSNTQFLMAITCTGDLLMWDILSLQAVIPHGKCNVFTIISREQSIRRVKLCDPSGLPVVTINTGESFLYHINMSSWMKISDEMFPTSEFKSPINNLLATTFGHRTGKGTLAEIQSMSNPSGRPLIASFAANSDARTNDTISHLEHQLASSLILQSPNEYKHWLLTYVRKLTTEAAESKLHELCNQLLGPSAGKTTKGKKWDPFVLGMTKRELLNEILPMIGSNRALQRLVTQFREQLDSLL